jgi:hypothetical protein
MAVHSWTSDIFALSPILHQTGRTLVTAKTVEIENAQQWLRVCRGFTEKRALK